MQTAETQLAPTKNRASLLVLIGRVFLLLCATSAAAAALVVIPRHDHAAPAARRYSCPMHPEVVGEGPGECPICHMALEPEAGASAAAASAEAASPSSGEAAAQSLVLSDEARALLRKSVGLVRRRVLAQELRLPAFVEQNGAITALISTDDIAALPASARGTFFSAAEPTTGSDVRMTVDPPLAWDRSLSRVRLEMVSGSRRIAAGAVGWVMVTPQEREVLVVPDTAINQGADGPYVLAVSEDGRQLSRRSVEVGRVFSGFAVVRSGVRDHEVILAKNTFFMDAERRLRAPRAVTVKP